MHACAMSGDKLVAAATVIAPPGKNAADATHQYGLIFRVANATSSGQATAADLPSYVRGRYIRLLTVGASVQWCFLLRGDTAPTLVYNQTSATGTGNAAAAQTLLDSQPEHVFCPPNAVRVVFISSAAAGNFEASVSGGVTSPRDNG